MKVNFTVNEKRENVIKVVGIYEDFKSEFYEEKVQKIKERGRFSGKDGELFFLQGDEEILFLGLGKKDEITAEKARVAAAKAVKELKKLKAKEADVIAFSKCNKILRALADGLFLGNYKFDKYMSKKDDFRVDNISIVLEKEIEEWISQEGVSLAKSTMIARDLVNEPANKIYPETLAQKSLELGAENGFQVEIIEEDGIVELGMESYMNVAMGSANRPKLIVMRYMGDDENKEDILGLVGKGLTYDSGGYSIKPTAGMASMKSDMGGAAAVIGAMCSIANMKLKRNVIAVVAACENMISSNAYKPGDVINSMGGKTIEVLNTDAEGRLTLIDAVHYILNNEGATKVVDIATLTGAVLGALGTVRTGVVSNNDEFFQALEEASSKGDERVWRMPTDQEYRDLIKSDIADLKNIGGKFAGTITAGLFIGEFVGDTPWIHMDIAGTAWTDAPIKAYHTKGGTGAGVKSLYYLAKGNN